MSALATRDPTLLASHAEGIEILQTLFADRAVWSHLALRNALAPHQQFAFKSLCFVAFTVSNGPFRTLWVGLDARASCVGALRCAVHLLRCLHVFQRREVCIFCAVFLRFGAELCSFCAAFLRFCAEMCASSAHFPCVFSTEMCIFCAVSLRARMVPSSAQCRPMSVAVRKPG